MSSASDVVRSFLALWETPGGIETSLHEFFTPETTWENVGMSTTTGAQEAKAVMDGFSSALGMAAMRVEMLALAESDGKVLTERIDHVLDEAGKSLMAIRVMGTFEISDGKIVKWRDYFDTAGFAAGG